MHRRFAGTIAGCAQAAAWVLAVTALLAWTQAVPAAAATAGLYRIAGIVVNSATGEPVQGAMVTLLTVEDSRTFASTESGNDGRFAIENLPAAKFQLTASKRGYCTSFYDQHEEFNSAIVTGEGQETGNLIFRLMPAAVISGVVTADGGDAVENATVMLFEKPRGHEPNARIEQAAGTTTDDTGAYELPDLKAGEYLLAVRAQPWYAMSHIDMGPQGEQETEQQAALDVAYPVTFFDSTTDEGSATPIVLSEGGREEANISLHAVPAVHLQVETPRRPDGTIAQPQLRQSIFGVDIDDGAFMSRTRDGSTEFGGVAPGQYELTQGDPPRVAEIDATASQQVDSDAGVPAVAVNGMVQDARGAAVTNALVTLAPADGNEGRMLTPTIFNRGSFGFQAVPAGAWALHVQSAEGLLPVTSVAVGSRRLAGDRIAVQDRPLSVAVTVSAARMRVEGSARKDGKGFAGAMVVLVPKDRTAMADLSRRDQSDSDGSFALRNVAPGDYTVVAIEDGWNLDWANPAVIARYLPGGVAVTVRDGADNGAGARINLPDAVTVQER